MASTKGAALPSMIGTSGPSISTSTLSTPRPRKAASRCSAVEQSGPEASPSTVANSVAVTARTSARISRSTAPLPATRWKTNAGVVVGGIERQGNRAARMHADAGNGNLFAQRCLLGTLHRTRLRRPTSKPHVPSQAPVGATFWPSRQRLPAYWKTPPATRKSLSHLKLRPQDGGLPTHVFLPTVTLFCRNSAGNHPRPAGKSSGF